MMYTDSTHGRNVAKDPAVAYFQNRYFMYYSVMPDISQSDGVWGIGIAVSDNLDDWKKIAELEPVGEVEKCGICAPGALVYDGKLHLFYQSYGKAEQSAIYHAYSEDGIHFKRNVTNPIVKAFGKWNNGRAIDADVCIFQDYLYLYFATRDPDGRIQMQGVSRCALDGRFEREDWTQCCDESILKPELPWEQDCIEAAATLVRYGKVYLFYGGAYNNAPQQIGVAVSKDGIHFQRLYQEPFIRNGSSGEWNSSESGHPYVFEDKDGRVYLFYQGNKDQGKSWYLSKVEIGFHNEVPYVIKEE